MNEIAQALRDRSKALAPRYDALGLRAADEIERLAAPANEVSVVFGLRELRLEPGRLIGLLAAGRDRVEERIIDVSGLTADIEPLERQRRETDGEHHRLDVFDPVAGEIADRAGMLDHTAMNEGEEAEGERSAPEERRADETRGERLQVRHPMHLPSRLTKAVRRDCACIPRHRYDPFHR